MDKSKRNTIRAHILVIDDEEGMRSGVIRVLGPRGHVVDTAENGTKGIALAKKRFYDIALIDYRMPDIDGFEVMDAIRSHSPETIQIVMTAYASYEMAVSATKKGAFDYLAKPFTPDELLIVVEKALEWRRLQIESQRLREERARNLLELATEKSRTTAIIQCMGEGVLVINNQDEIVLWNPMVVQFLGLKHVEAGMSLHAMEQGEALISLVRELRSLTVEKTEVLVREIRVGEVILLGTATLLNDHEGNPLGTVIILRDITAQKRIEELKNQFVTLVSHELRAPVSAMHGYIDVVLNQSAGDDPQLYSQMLQRSKMRAEALLELIKDLLTISAIEAGDRSRHLELCDLAGVITEVLDLMKVEIEKRGIQVEVHLDPGLPSVTADRKEMNQVFNNLIVNAIKYNKEQGSIRISGGFDRPMVWVSVEDTGIGMDKEECSRCFEEFYRAKNTKTRNIIGTGLGLSIVDRIVRRYAGRIDIASTPGKGTRFTVYLPVTRDNQ
ncbi:MAG: ATP-binding protein [bacterium]